MKIILASASPRRLSLLRNIGLEPEVIAAQIDEDSIPGDSPAEKTRRCALAKASAVAEQVEEGLVIGADTVVVLGDEILGKPASEDVTRDMLARLSGRTHRVITGLAVVDARSKRSVLGHETTAVTFRQLTRAEIASYVASGEPMDKAGAYGIQALGSLLVEGIQGCYFNVVGLPLVRLAKMCKEFGFDLLIDLAPHASHAQEVGGHGRAGKAGR